MISSQLDMVSAKMISGQLDMVSAKVLYLTNWFGAVHILRQPPEGGEGVWQMLTIADEGGRGGKPKADHC